MFTDAQCADRKTFRALRLEGLMWEGSYEQAAAGEIGRVMSELRRLLQLAPSDPIYGVSWTDREGGFRHFCGAEAKAETAIQGLELVEIPTLDCLTVPHNGGDATDVYAFLMAERDRLGLREHHDPSMIDEHLADGTMRLWLAVGA